MRSRDTTEEAAAIHEEVQRRIGVAGRLVAALQLSDLAHAFALAGVRQRHPELSETQAIAVLTRQLYGEHG